MQRVLIVIVLSFACMVQVRAQKPETVIGAGLGAGFKAPYFQLSGTVRTLSADTNYILTGIYYVDSLAAIVIQPGTVIFGDSATGGSLVIKRGGIIHANGTSDQPIVLTSRFAPGNRRPGQWGGVILLGSARNNQSLNQTVEGGLHPSAVYGGTNDDDSSGVMRYVRIEFGGIPFLTDNEINGLTMGSVGQRTVLEYIQVSMNNDDAFEWFGGTVNARYLVAWRNLDDDFDTDFGWSGTVQFGYAKRDPAMFDASPSSNSNGFESDNQGGSNGPWSARPTTSGIFVNTTMIGPLADTSQYNGISPKHDYAAFLRRRTAVSIYNSILAGYRHGIVIRNDSTHHNASVGDLQIRYTSLQAGRRVIGNDTPPASFATSGGFNGFSAETWFLTSGWGNMGYTPRRPSDIGLASSAFDLNPNNDPRPAIGSEPTTAGTDFSNPRLSGLVNVPYRGAFDPALPMNQQWTSGWTNFDPENTQYVTSVSETGGGVPDRFTLLQNYPNPFNPATTIQFSLPQSGRVTLSVYNVLGEQVATLVDQELRAGSYQSQFNAENISSGVYIYKLSTGTFTETRKMILTR